MYIWVRGKIATLAKSIRKGFPDSLRQRAWIQITGVDKIMKERSGSYESLVNSVERLAAADAVVAYPSGTNASVYGAFFWQFFAFLSVFSLFMFFMSSCCDKNDFMSSYCDNVFMCFFSMFSRRATDNKIMSKYRSTI